MKPTFTGNVKLISLCTAAVVTTLGLVTTWDDMGLPRPAFHSEVQELKVYAEGTRKIALNQEWFRISAQLKLARAKLQNDLHNLELIKEVTRLELALQAVDDQLDELKKSKT
jgi:hypothetical protein